MLAVHHYAKVNVEPTIECLNDCKDPSSRTAPSWSGLASLIKTHGGSRECLISRLLNAVEYNDANDRDNDRSNAGQQECPHNDGLPFFGNRICLYAFLFPDRLNGQSFASSYPQVAIAMVRSCMTTACPLLALSDHALLHCMSPLLTQSGHCSGHLWLGPCRRILVAEVVMELCAQSGHARSLTLVT
jgi:hypothetical protein